MPTLKIYSYLEIADINGEVRTWGNKSQPVNMTVDGIVYDNTVAVANSTATSVWKEGNAPNIADFEFLQLTSDQDADLQITIDRGAGDTFIQFAIKADIPFRFSDDAGWLNDGTIDNMTDGTSGKDIGELWIYQTSGVTANVHVVVVT